MALRLQSTDEMGELWIQVLPRQTNDWATLAKDYQPRVLRDAIAYNEYLLRTNPNDARAYRELGKALLLSGRQDEALQRLTVAVELPPQDDETFYYLGLLFRMRKDLARSRAAFETALRLNPDNAKAHGNLGFVFLEQGEFARAEPHLKSALRINPADSMAREGLEIVAKAKALAPNP
jgi:tetratricopeptide (TPR) repeat protein